MYEWVLILRWCNLVLLSADWCTVSLSHGHCVGSVYSSSTAITESQALCSVFSNSKTGKQTRRKMSSLTDITFAQLEKNSRDFFRNNPGCKVQTSENMIASKTMGMHKDVTEEFANKAYPLVLQKVVGRFSSF